MSIRKHQNNLTANILKRKLPSKNKQESKMEEKPKPRFIDEVNKFKQNNSGDKNGLNLRLEGLQLTIDELAKSDAMTTDASPIVFAKGLESKQKTLKQTRKKIYAD